MKRRTAKKFRKISSIVVMISIIIFTGYFAAKFINAKETTKDNSDKDKATEDNIDNPNINGNEVKEDNTIKISSLGNIIFHDKQLQAAKTDTGYDFKESFKYIKNILKDSDLSVAVLETTLQGNGNYSGYPLFNSPDEVLTALKDSGINMINLGTNHIWDGGIDALKRTVEITKKQGLGVTGARESVNEPRYEIVDIDGQKIGMISYVFETGVIGGKSTINSIPISESSKALLNTFRYDELDKFYSDLQQNLDEMKSEGAKFTMVAMHWGEEYDNEPNNYQVEISEKLNEMGVDIVFGNHPHVIQPYEIITNSRGKKTFVIYGQGNNLSNQCFEELGDARTEDGYIVNFELAAGDTELSIKKYEVIPLWMYREPRADGLYTHRMIPLGESAGNDVAVPASSGESSAAASLKRIEDVLGKDKIGAFEF